MGNPGNQRGGGMQIIIPPRVQRALKRIKCPKKLRHWTPLKPILTNKHSVILRWSVCTDTSKNEYPLQLHHPVRVELPAKKTVTKGTKWTSEILGVEKWARVSIPYPLGKDEIWGSFAVTGTTLFGKKQTYNVYAKRVAKPQTHIHLIVELEIFWKDIKKHVNPHLPELKKKLVELTKGAGFPVATKVIVPTMGCPMLEKGVILKLKPDPAILRFIEPGQKKGKSKTRKKDKKQPGLIPFEVILMEECSGGKWHTLTFGKVDDALTADKCVQVAVPRKK